MNLAENTAVLISCTSGLRGQSGRLESFPHFPFSVPVQSIAVQYVQLIVELVPVSKGQLQWHWMDITLLLNKHKFRWILTQGDKIFRKFRRTLRIV